MTYQGEKSMQVSSVEPSSETWHFPDFSAIEKGEVIENQIVYDDELRVGLARELLLEDVYFWYGKFQARSKRPLLVLSSGSHIQMTFSLQSATTYFTEILPKPFVRFKSHQHNLLLLPQRNILVQWLPGEETEAFAINITTEFFFSNLPQTHPLYGHFQNGIEEGLPAFLSQQNLPVTPKIISTLFEILNCPYNGYHKSLFVKAKVIELLALQLDQYEQLQVPDITSAPKQEYVEKMHLVRNIIIENLEQPLSLKDLAHQVGTNEFNLKKHFKQVFGTTVFGYLHDFRMQQSKEQLSHEGSKISEVAQRMGYKHATHFTAAFKKYYGYVPNKMRIALLHLFHLGEYLIQLGTEILETGVMVEVG